MRGLCTLSSRKGLVCTLPSYRGGFPFNGVKGAAKGLEVQHKLKRMAIKQDIRDFLPKV